MTDAYHFANSIWIERFLGTKIDGPSVLRSSIFALTPWFVSCAICFVCGRSLEYIYTPAFYVGSAGVFLTTIGIIYGSSAQHKVYNRLASCFAIDQEQRRKHVVTALERHSKFWQHFRAMVIIFIAGSCLVWCSFFFWREIRPYSTFLHTYLPRFRVLDDHGWYEPDGSWCAILILHVFLFFVAAVLGTSASIILRFPIFLWRISSEKPRLPPTLIKSRFRPTTTLYTITSLLWLGGAFSLSYFLGQNGDWISYLLVAFAFLLGIISLIIPQIAYLKVVSRSEDELLQIVSDRLVLDKSDSIISPDDMEYQFDRYGKVTIEGMLALVKYQDWVYPLHQTYFVALTYSFSAIGSIFGWDKVLKLFTNGN